MRQALRVISEKEPGAGPSIKAFDLLLLKGLSQNHPQSRNCFDVLFHFTQTSQHCPSTLSLTGTHLETKAAPAGPLAAWTQQGPGTSPVPVLARPHWAGDSLTGTDPAKPFHPGVLVVGPPRDA